MAGATLLTRVTVTTALANPLAPSAILLFADGRPRRTNATIMARSSSVCAETTCGASARAMSPKVDLWKSRHGEVEATDIDGKHVEGLALAKGATKPHSRHIHQLVSASQGPSRPDLAPFRAATVRAVNAITTPTAIDKSELRDPATAPDNSKVPLVWKWRGIGAATRVGLKRGTWRADSHVTGGLGASAWSARRGS
jgi:hypothetical protein